MSVLVGKMSCKGCGKDIDIWFADDGGPVVNGRFRYFLSICHDRQTMDALQFNYLKDEKYLRWATLTLMGRYASALESKGWVACSTAAWTAAVVLDEVVPNG